MRVREIFEDKIITVSNFLTAMRILAATFLGYCIHKEHQTGDTGYIWYEMGFVFFIIMTDFLDGNPARLMNQVSKPGQYLDPIADKFSGLFAKLFLALCGAVYIMSLDYSYPGTSLKHFSVFLLMLFYCLVGILYIKTYARQYFDKKA